MKIYKAAILVFALGFLTCKEGTTDVPNSFIFPLLQNNNGTPGTNLAQVTFDSIEFDDVPIISCDSDNSSGQGIVVDLPDMFPPNYVVKIETVPSSSSYTFPVGGALDLYLGSSHKPDDPTNCTLTRTTNTFLRYSANLSTNCTVANHTFSRLEIDCIPN
ncbi:hypothetical protein [Leptospira dzoumogneensis]|uniref:Uncharacterized protein n=1 Tax=Leptospira dzoumogneensis TaxID=2484904 RepID=A0A4Z1AJT2_9LEPT|nr:hypothetical protein [Leptospira dzoumogneensis]TGM96035.1 hypothetical protein EHR06_17030 [Leptospira dzoumogneensis]